MTRPRDRRRAEHRETLRGAVFTVLSNTLPELTDAHIGAVLQAARASTGISLQQLADHLAAHPDALVSGDSRCPAVVIRLAHVLHDAGHAAVVRPGCADCGTLTRALPRSGPGGRRCQMCAVRASRGTCARCGRTGTRIVARRPEGGICYPCYRVDAEVVEDCGRCGRRRMPVTRLADGGGSAWVAGPHLDTAATCATWTLPPRSMDPNERSAETATARPGRDVRATAAAASGY